MDGPPPDELHVVPANFTHLQSPQSASQQDAPSVGYQVGFQADTPLAGYAVPTTLLFGPRDGGNRIIAAGAANADGRHTFLPGVWRYEGYFIRSGGVSLLQVEWGFAGAGTTDPTNLATLDPFPGSSGVWREDHTLSTNQNVREDFSGVIYAPDRWLCFLLLITPALDADIFLGHFSVLPVYLFDEAGST